MIKRNPFIKLLFFIVLASLLNSCANLNKLPKHNTPLIKDDIRTLGKKRMEAILNFHYKKEDYKEFMDIVLHSRSISSVIKKLQK